MQKGGDSIKNKSFPVILCTLVLCATAALILIPNVQASTMVTISANADTSIWSEYPTGNYGTTSLWVLTSNEPPIYSRRSLLNFDLSTIPGGVTITSATLNLYFYKAPHISRLYSAHRITGAWAESTVTWNTAPSFDSTATSTITTGTTDEVWLSWDVTADVTYGYSNPSNWQGILIKDHTESYSSRTWTIYGYAASKEHGNATWHPYLEVTYTEQVPPTIESCDSTGVKKDTFVLSDEVYATGTGYQPSTTYDVYLVEDVTWVDGMAIPPGVPGTATSISSDATGDVPATLLWSGPLVAGKYDIVVDVDGDGLYYAEADALDDNDIEVTAGFFVIPEFWLGTILGLAGCFAAFGVFHVSKRKHQ